MVKKTLNIILVLFLLICMPLAIFANTENETQVITVNELEILKEVSGSQLRLLQLQDRVDAQIAAANEIVTNLDENTTIDKELLESIIYNFEEIKSEIENFDMNQSAEILAEKYVSLKSDAIELSNQFRSEITSKMSIQKQEELRNKANLKKEEVLAKKNQRIEELKNKFNSRIIENSIKRFGINNSSLIEKIKTGELNREEILNQVKNQFRNISVEERKDTLFKIQEERQKLRIENKVKVEEIRIQNQERIENIKQRNQENIERLKTRVQNIDLNERNEYLKEFENLSIEEREELRNKYLNNIREVME